MMAVKNYDKLSISKQDWLSKYHARSIHFCNANLIWSTRYTRVWWKTVNVEEINRMMINDFLKSDN